MRQIVLLGLLGLLVACGGDSPTQPTLQPDPDRDGDGILNEVDACPDQAENFNNLQDGDGCPDVPRDFYVLVKDDIEAFWDAGFTASQLAYTSISVFEAYTQPITTPCGTLELNNAFYCTVNSGVYYDDNLLTNIFLAQVGDAAPAFIIAHELGHHVSFLLGWLPLVTLKHFELMADCLGGAWIGDVASRGLVESGDLEEILVTLVAIGDPSWTWFLTDMHGTAEQRTLAFALGADQGSAACFPTVGGVALDFNNSRVVVPDHSDLDLGATYTIEAWIKPSAVANLFQHVVSKWGGGGNASYTVEINGGRLRAAIHNGVDPTQAIESQGVLVNGQWQHVAVVLDNGTLRLYINGFLDTQVTGSQTPMNSTQPLFFGAESPGGGHPYTGLIDEVQIWNVARTTAEIGSDMNTVLSGFESGLVGYWRFEEGSGDIAADATGRGHNGQLGSAVGPDANDPQWTLVTGAARVSASRPRNK